MRTDNDDDEQRERLRNITERIQVGDVDEGTEALQEVISMARAEERANARLAVREEMVNLRLNSENDTALQKFQRKYPRVAEDPLLLEAGVSALRREIAKDLRAAGVTDEELAPIQHDTGRLASLHGKARLMGRARSAEKLLDDVGGVMSRSFNIPAATRSNREFLLDERQRRGFSNENLVEEREPPARRDGVRRVAQADAAADHDRRRQIIAEARRARGFPALD
jgi:hypothetical protein